MKGERNTYGVSRGALGLAHASIHGHRPVCRGRAYPGIESLPGGGSFPGPPRPQSAHHIGAPLKGLVAAIRLTAALGLWVVIAVRPARAQAAGDEAEAPRPAPGAHREALSPREPRGRGALEVGLRSETSILLSSLALDGTVSLSDYVGLGVSAGLTTQLALSGCEGASEDSDCRHMVWGWAAPQLELRLPLSERVRLYARGLLGGASGAMTTSSSQGAQSEAFWGAELGASFHTTQRKAALRVFGNLAPMLGESPTVPFAFGGAGVGLGLLW